MKQYNREIPLLSIHIPKCGGTSFKEVLKEWYGGNLLLHYYNEKEGRVPKKHKLKTWYSKYYKKDLCIHGHFNHKREFGVDNYYPEIKQAITFLRDPLEIALSVFFYNHRLIKEGKNYRDKKKIEMYNDIDEFLENTNSYIKLFLPKEMLIENVDNYFVHIGIMEHYQKSMDILAEKLGKPKIKVPHKNISQRTQNPSESSIKKFKSKCKFEYLLYEKGLKVNNII